MRGHVQFLYREPNSNLTQDRYLGLVRGGDSDGGRLHLSRKYQPSGYFAAVTTSVQMAFILIVPNVPFHVGVGPCCLPCDDVEFQVSYVLSCCRCIPLRLSFLYLRRESSPVSGLVAVVADSALGGFLMLLGLLVFVRILFFFRVFTHLNFFYAYACWLPDAGVFG